MAFYIIPEDMFIEEDPELLFTGNTVPRYIVS
jgi:hypothetical protein